VDMSHNPEPPTVAVDFATARWQVGLTKEVETTVSQHLDTYKMASTK
jgi:hypothetical protein